MNLPLISDRRSALFGYICRMSAEARAHRALQLCINVLHGESLQYQDSRVWACVYGSARYDIGLTLCQIFACLPPGPARPVFSSNNCIQLHCFHNI